MRRINFWWTYLVGCIVCIAYGGGTLLYHFRKGNGLSVHALILLIIGGVCLLIFLVLYILFLIQKKKTKAPEEEPTPELVEDTNDVEEVETSTEEPQAEDTSDNDIDYASIERINPTTISYRPSSSSSGRTVYVKKVGYGPILRIEGDRFLDMRSNTYYHIQGNMVNQDGGGPAFEISGNSIRSAFGGYLYEISGSNINKVFGGFYASISGNYITLFDASEKYEITDSLNKKQLLIVAALLFGSY